MLTCEALTFTDPYPYQRSVRNADAEVLPTAKGVFHAELTKIALSRVWMQKGRETLPRVCQGTVGHGRAAIEFLSDADQPAMRHCGMDVPPGVIIVSDGQTVHRRTEAAARWNSMSLAPDDLYRTARVIAGRELTVPSVTHLVTPDSALMARLSNLHQALANLAMSAPEILARPEVARAFEHDLAHVMVRCLTGTSPTSMSNSQRHHHQIMAKFEDYLSENLLEPIYLADICAATGASERVLRICSQEHLGMGPVHYLWLRRMHLVRRALEKDISKTVTQIATDHGFWELGRFSAEYRTLFGEPPSATLRRGKRAPLNAVMSA